MEWVLPTASSPVPNKDRLYIYFEDVRHNADGSLEVPGGEAKYVLTLFAWFASKKGFLAHP